MSATLRVLILEDSENDSRLLVHKLGREGGYKVSFERVESLNALKAALNKQAWDILISDHSMPKFSAIQALEELRERGLDIPVIILSGTIEPLAAVAAMKAGASDYIMKSDMTRLLPAIERELRGAQSRHEKRLTENKLQQAQKMESIGRLAGGVAHDFNNLLTAIGGYCFFLLTSIDAQDPRHADVLEIKKAGERATALTRQLLAFSRQQVFELKVLDLNCVMIDIEKIIRRVIGANIDLVFAPAKDLGRVRADAGQLEQVLINLCVNAKDAMPEGGKITIETSNADAGENGIRGMPGRYVMLTVGDSGSGMDAEVQAHMFEPFFTTKEQGKGTGLGLATVYGIVEQSRGSIQVQSEVGRGTTFKIFLPRVEEKLDEAKVDPAVPVSKRGSEVVLLVEDDDMVRKFVQRVLVENGYIVMATRDPREAISICEKHNGPIQLLLTDIIMPQINGYKLAERLELFKPGMKVIFMSGYTPETVSKKNLAAHGAPFLQKPMSPGALIRKIREVLDAPSRGSEDKVS